MHTQHAAPSQVWFKCDTTPGFGEFQYRVSSRASVKSSPTWQKIKGKKQDSQQLLMVHVAISTSNGAHQHHCPLPIAQDLSPRPTVSSTLHEPTHKRRRIKPPKLAGRLYRVAGASALLPRPRCSARQRRVCVDRSASYQAVPGNSEPGASSLGAYVTFPLAIGPCLLKDEMQHGPIVIVVMVMVMVVRVLTTLVVVVRGLQGSRSGPDNRSDLCLLRAQCGREDGRTDGEGGC